ncbi:hypothetical protein [Paraliobacillus sp. JSM ZJ581]|uniref:hypothetical protein n=1 Tax=Paraliobacillus sp. JSM ZJ581 TaxID=3342118 RepID=UPI0035A9ACA1
MRIYGVVIIIFSVIILLILPNFIFPDPDTVDSTGIVNTIRFTALALIFAAIGIKLLFKK